LVNRACRQSLATKNAVTPAQTGQVSSVRIGLILLACSNSQGKLPRLLLSVGDGFVRSPQIINVVPDTGAEVTVLGETYLSQLGIKRSRLNPPKTHLEACSRRCYIRNRQLHVILHYWRIKYS